MTLKLLLDWAQIIYSMKNIKIYPKDWLQLHPYKQSDPTDSYYTNIANRIYGMLEETRLAYSFEKDEVKQISIRMAAYFEDVISGLNIWRSFITEHKALYGKFLPFYTPDDHYYDDESTTKISGSCFGITHSSITGFTKAHSSVPTMRQTATQPN